MDACDDDRIASYVELYDRWERQPWSVRDIDLTEDRRQWQDAAAVERECWWGIGRLPGFYIGEVALSEAFPLYQDAVPLLDQKHFLATQTVDEAKHAVFFERYLREVLDNLPPRTAEAKAKAAISPGYRHFTQKAIPQAAQNMRCAGPRSEALFEGVVLTHLLVEAGIAMSSMKVGLAQYERLEVLPGLRLGLQYLIRDEIRHIGFGVHLLKDMLDEDPRRITTLTRSLATFLPHVHTALVPPLERHAAWLAQGLDPWERHGLALHSIDRQLKRLDVPFVFSQFEAAEFRRAS